MRFGAKIFTLPLAAGLLLAQTQTTPQSTPQSTTKQELTEQMQQSGMGNWTGILVASSCSNTNMPRSTAAAADRDAKSKADRVADMNRDRARDVNQGTGTDAQLERTRTMEQTGGADRAKGQHAEDMKPGDLADTSTWDRSCFISSKTDEFTFHTTDGRFLKLDSASNQKIVDQLKSTQRVATAGKIFRVKIKGSVESNTLRVTDIQM